MAKIYKSNDIFMNKNQPVILNIPKISKGLRDFVTGESGNLTRPSGWDVAFHPNDGDDWFEEDAKSSVSDETFVTMKSAIEEAERINKENADKADDLFRQARTDGYNKGLEDAEKENESYRIGILKEFQEKSEKQEEEFTQKIAAIEEQILDLSLFIAKKVVKYEISKDDEAMLVMVQDALNQIRIKNGITVKASKYVCETIKTMEDLQVENIQIIPQEGWTNDACRIESLLGTLDLGWEKKMERISQMLYGELV